MPESGTPKSIAGYRRKKPSTKGARRLVFDRFLWTLAYRKRWSSTHIGVFSKYVKLYPLKTATTKSSLNKLINYYFREIVKPKVILSDNGTQFQSPVWKENMHKHGVGVRYSAMRHPQSNPSERCMREISKFLS
jgi:transposase InsO family protein